MGSAELKAEPACATTGAHIFRTPHSTLRT